MISAVHLRFRLGSGRIRDGFLSEGVGFQNNPASRAIRAACVRFAAPTFR